MGGVGLVSDPRFRQHDTGPGHPERPERLARVDEALESGGLAARCARVEPVEAEDDWLREVHDPAYIEHVEQTVASGAPVLDSMDTAIGPDSARIARLAAGSVVALAREVAEGRLDRGFVAARPPGHHAERDLAMGFCLFNNVAVAAGWLRKQAGLERVLIVDWDVHHGNGTQHIFETDPDVFYFSLHQFPLYPGTGERSERGTGAGDGATLNCPLPPGSGDEAFLSALGVDLRQAADAFRPRFVLLSAGFDAHRSDPLAQLQVTTEAYAEATRIVRGVADDHAAGRIVSVLEGGYDLDALAESTSTHLSTMMED
jgi:acetoin utilization deacetylase AcuC-like enzyme